MATYKVEGLAELNISLEEMATIPAEVKHDMLAAAAELAKNDLKQAAPRDTGQLADSIKSSSKKDKNGNEYYIVAPTGTRTNGTRNAEVGFVLEFGSPRRHIKARQWVGKTVEQNSDKYTRAMTAIYDNWLKSNGL